MRIARRDIKHNTSWLVGPTGMVELVVEKFGLCPFKDPVDRQLGFVSIVNRAGVHDVHDMLEPVG